MLDVHPPHEKTHSWTDFFIHIATIVVGLLIAVALEQTVEWAHRRHELRETRESMQRELEHNREAFAFNVQALEHDVAALRNNLLVLTYLREHPGTKREDLPGILVWPNLYTPFSDVAWRGAQTSGVTQTMPREEVFDASGLYGAMADTNAVAQTSWDALTRAETFTFRDPDPTHLGSAELDDEIHRVEDVLASKYSLGIALAGLSHGFPAFGKGPGQQNLNNMTIAAPISDEERSRLEAARQKTLPSLAATPEPKW